MRKTELAKADMAENGRQRSALAEDPILQEGSIAGLAYQLWEKRGRPEGSPDKDWYRAEQELTAPLDSTNDRN
jgi:hypothetical protein